MSRVTGALVLIFVFWGLTGCSEQSDSSGEGAQRSTPIAAYEVTPRDLSRQVTLSATVEPRIRVMINSRALGMVEEVLVEEGDKVSQGQLLARFEVSEQRAELERAQARADEARLELERLQQLRDSETISIAELQRAEAAWKVADAEVQLWQTRIDFGEIRAPLDAVVTERWIEVGEAVEPQQSLFQLADMKELVLRPGVSERDIRYLASGQSVPVQLDGLPDETWDATIRRIFPAADANSRMVRIEILLPEDSFERGARPGFLGRIPLIVDARPDSLAVPAAAVGEREGQRYVYVVRNEELERQPIQPGITRGQWTEVLEGIETGDIVLATNPIDMREGMRVRIVNWRG